VWAPNGLVQHGQGKWYPGEPLPRWQIGIHWRRDGQPLWSDASLLADPWAGDSADVNIEAAQHFLLAVADGLGLPATQVRAVFEDPLSRLSRAVRLPAGQPVEPADDLEVDTAAARAALVAALETPVTEPAAYLLPLHRREDDGGWASANWRLRRGRVVLLDGDSPAGLRLPLNSISWRPPRCAVSRCPRTSRWRWFNRCWCARWWPGSGMSPCGRR
jgi:uncharacterized protein (DUF2126 family)